jgi:hypothetical protein
MTLSPEQNPDLALGFSHKEFNESEFVRDFVGSRREIASIAN